MADVVLCDVGDDGVALLTLNRPDRLNAWTYEMQVALFDLLQTCADDKRVRMIVITGAGRGFCPGADMNDLGALSSDGAAVEARANRTDTRPITFAMAIPKPVIAAINGACAGLGLAFALTCDVRFCAENAYSYLRAEPVPHGNLAMKTKRGRILHEPYGVVAIVSESSPTMFVR